MAFQSIAAPNCNYEESFLVLHSQSVSWCRREYIESTILVAEARKAARNFSYLGLRAFMAFFICIICCLGGQVSGREADLPFGLLSII
jgi:hypothetical protein